MQPATAPQESSSDSRLIAKSVVRAAEKLEISNRVLARIIGVSDATVSRLKKGEYPRRAVKNRSSWPCFSFVSTARSML